MRKLLILAAALVACSKAETPAADTTKAAVAPAPAPAKLTVADLQGTWKGETKPETGDSVLFKWTAESITDSTGKLTIDGVKEPINFTRVLDADSMVATSAPYADPANPKGPKVTFRSVGRMKDGKLEGTGRNMLASKPDSVVNRTRWTATRAPAK